MISFIRRGTRQAHSKSLDCGDHFQDRMIPWMGRPYNLRKRIITAGGISLNLPPQPSGAV